MPIPVKESLSAAKIERERQKISALCNSDDPTDVLLIGSFRALGMRQASGDTGWQFKLALAWNSYFAKKSHGWTDVEILHNLAQGETIVQQAASLIGADFRGRSRVC